MKYTTKSKIRDIIADPAFNGYGRLLFPLQRNYMQGASLETMNLSWYTNIRPEDFAAVVNHLWERASAGETVFYDVYAEEEKLADPAKRDTGLFLFRGTPGGKVAILSAGGGFRYVGAMHDSFPHALALSRKGVNAFALIYRPGGDSSCEDLARAVAFVHENADALQLDVRGYSLWGGSAGARTAAIVGALGTARFGEKDYPRPAAVVMQYTGFADIYGNEPPTYGCAGANDGAGLRRTMRERTEAIRRNGTDAEFEVFDGVAHGFGLGTGTAAEGWIDRAVQFWERQLDTPIGRF
ncbi:MAG: alpha/beta hydrolase [Schwartzia sp.]|nr:alpha/beta hydrolase [Schwartzia sp. (in: firmicutes)]